MTTYLPDVHILRDRPAMGRAAARDIAEHLRGLLASQPTARLVFAAAPSQSSTLAALVDSPGIDWSRVTAFHMDEYLGLPAQAPQRFSRWLDRELFDRLPFAAVHRIEPDADPAAEAERYAALLAEAPIDVVCLGIGQNGHLAFNDPPVADFQDPLMVKVVELDDVCRRQQVADGAFATVEDVPELALTLTVPRLLAADRLFCVVPGSDKRAAVTAALNAPITTADPATALRTHPAVSLYLDWESAPAGLPAT